MGLFNRFMSMLREHKGTRDDNSDDAGEEVGLPLPDLPEDIWHHICSKLPMRDAARLACVSHVFLSSWGCHPNLTLTKESICSKENLRKWEKNSNYEFERHIRKYIKTIEHILANRRGADAKTFMLHLHGPSNAISYDLLDGWLQNTITPVLEELALYMYLLKTKYNFPCSLLSERSGNTIRHIRLYNCILRPPAELSLRCLTELFLHTVHVAEDELGHILSSSHALEILTLENLEDITRLKIPCQLRRLRLLVVFDCYRIKAIELKAPNLSSFDLTGHAKLQISLGESLQAKNPRLTSTETFAPRYHYVLSFDQTH